MQEPQLFPFFDEQQRVYPFPYFREEEGKGEVLKARICYWLTYGPFDAKKVPFFEQNKEHKRRSDARVEAQRYIVYILELLQ